MDIADDISYSTYDLEDAFKAGFLSPLSMLASSSMIKEAVANTVKKRLDQYYNDVPPAQRQFGLDDVNRILIELFSDVYGFGGTGANLLAQVVAGDADPAVALAAIASNAYRTAAETASTGYFRTDLTSEFVGRFINGVEVLVSKENLALSRARLQVDIFKMVEVLKNYAYETLIMSPMLKVAEHRGKDIVKKIFYALESNTGHLLMPDDFRNLYNNLTDKSEKRRVICDFIAGMTDRYALQFFSRLFSTNPETIYSPI